jgi:predicted metalloprotease with PDZ domain
MERYYGNPGNYVFSAEKVSLSAYAPNGMLGDYFGSTHLQGELLGTIMDLLIRDHTNGIHSIDDVMQLMMERFSGPSGFKGSDIEEIVAGFCHCSMKNFFANYIRGANPLDFNSYIRLIGLRADTVWTRVVNKDGTPAADLRVYAWQKSGESSVRIGITDPSGNWWRAGLHTGDIIKEINKVPIRSTSDFWQIISRIKIGDITSVVIQAPAGLKEMKITITGHQRPHVHISKIKSPSEKQQKLYSQWALGN